MCLNPLNGTFALDIFQPLVFVDLLGTGNAENRCRGRRAAAGVLRPPSPIGAEFLIRVAQVYVPPETHVYAGKQGYAIRTEVDRNRDRRSIPDSTFFQSAA